MYDYAKMRITDKAEINRICDNSLLDFRQQFEVKTGNIISYPLQCKNGVWTFERKSPTLLQISGSLHKYWNNGTNENDFHFNEAQAGIGKFCKTFQMNPDLVNICNLEFGVNIKPVYNATEIIEQIICYKNKPPIKPYDDRPGYCYIEFAADDNYIKAYDKGKQYGIDNIMRFEIKAMNARYLAFAGIKVLSDLLKPEIFDLLGLKINGVFKSVIFDDDTIQPGALKLTDRKVYDKMRNPREWLDTKGSRNTTHRDREKRFISIVAENGQRNLSEGLQQLIYQKIIELGQNKNSVDLHT